MPKDSALTVVGGFNGYERVIRGTGFRIRRNPEVSAECSLTLWYDDETKHDPILAAKLRLNQRATTYLHQAVGLS